VGPGIRYKFLTGPKRLLVGETGANYATEEYTDGTDKDYIEGRVFGKYEYAFTEKNRFSQSVEFLYDFDDSESYKVNSVTALISALNSYLSLKASYDVNYNNKPVPETLDKTDTILGITLVVSF
jgi:putative salt-induced outer membrane protein YdiY